MKGDDLGKGRGPWTVQESFRAEAVGMRDWVLSVVGSCSRYAEPEAEGVNPVLRTVRIISRWSSMNFYGHLIVKLESHTYLPWLVGLPRSGGPL